YVAGLALLFSGAAIAVQLLAATRLAARRPRSYDDLTITVRDDSNPTSMRLELRVTTATAAAPLAVLPLLASLAGAQQPSPPLPEPKNWTAAQDHQQMMEQLGIKALRPGPSGNEADPNHA